MKYNKRKWKQCNNWNYTYELFPKIIISLSYNFTVQLWKIGTSLSYSTDSIDNDTDYDMDELLEMACLSGKDLVKNYYKGQWKDSQHKIEYQKKALKQALVLEKKNRVKWKKIKEI